MGMELLIERLAVPNLWLQPIIPCNYMKELPVWRYAGHVESEGTSDGGSPDEGEEDHTGATTLPSLFICEKCRIQQTDVPQPPQQVGNLSYLSQCNQ